jgi:hypothetical protein
LDCLQQTCGTDSLVPGKPREPLGLENLHEQT